MKHFHIDAFEYFNSTQSRFFQKSKTAIEDWSIIFVEQSGFVFQNKLNIIDIFIAVFQKIGNKMHNVKHIGSFLFVFGAYGVYTTSHKYPQWLKQPKLHSHIGFAFEKQQLLIIG